jgi:hypothetical protein
MSRLFISWDHENLDVTVDLTISSDPDVEGADLRVDELARRALAEAFDPIVARRSVEDHAQADAEFAGEDAR